LKPHMALEKKKDQNLIECAQTGSHLMCHYNQACRRTQACRIVPTGSREQGQYLI